MEKHIIVCDECGKEHHPKYNTFYTILGNVYMGLQGGLIGHDLSKGLATSHFCRKCMEKVLYLNE